MRAEVGQIRVEVLGRTVELNIVDGVPQCYCCQAPMVRVDDGRWMCRFSYALQGMFREAMERYESALARPE